MKQQYFPVFRQFLFCGVLAVAILCLGAGMVAAGEEEAIVVRGAEVIGGPVTPVTLHVEWDDLEPAPRWQPGDPIKEIPRRFFPREGDGVEPGIGLPDPYVRLQRSAAARADRGFELPSINIAGQGFTGVSPPDPVGDIGPAHYVQAINSAAGSIVQIYTKDGTTVGPSFLMDSLGSTSCKGGAGDPIVLWDHLAERWVLQEFSSGGNYLCFYISGTADPTEGTWHHYSYQCPNFPDYPHIGVWPDAYYVTTNEHPGAIYALDRANMVAGATARPFQRFAVSLLDGYAFDPPTPADLDGAEPPPDGTPGYIMRHVDDEAHVMYADDAVSDRLEVFTLTVDWDAPENSVLAQLPDIVIADYNSWLVDYATYYSVPQPGVEARLDPIREVVLNRLVYRNFADYEILAGVFPTNLIEATSGDAVSAGLRWFELRKVGAGDWTLHQEGTYQPGDESENRFVGSLAMDGAGNLALGYSFTDVDPAVEASLHYTGRLDDDPLYVMTQAETSLALGSGTGSGRWGDYATMTVDPVDDCTFWFTGEYMDGSWATRIGTFRFDDCGCSLTLDRPTAAASAVAANTIRVTWDDSSVAEVTEYRVYRSVLPDGPFERMVTVPDSSPATGGGAGYAWDDTTVSGGTSYAYMVRSSDGENCLSAASDPVEATATGVCTLAPTFAGVTGVDTAALESCGLDVTWEAATLDCGAGVVYNVYRSETEGFTPGSENLIAPGVTGLSYFDDDGLVYGTDYTYIVRAEDVANGLEESNTVELTDTPTGPAVVGVWQDDGGDNQPAQLSGDAPWFIDSTEGNIGPAVYKTGEYGAFTCSGLVTPKLHLATDAVLTFYSKYDIEDDWDKGEVQVSTDGGSTWERVPVDYPGYASNSGNDACGLPEGDYFTGTDLNYALYTASLSAWNDTKVLIRWVLATDQLEVGTGWWVDDIEITEVNIYGPCTDGAEPIFSDGFEGGDTSVWSVTVP